MAEERSLTNTSSTAATTRATDSTSVTTSTDDTELTKEELQRRMEEARESISSTVAEIKDTVQTQYEQVKETVNEKLDWREHYKKRPAAFAAGAAVGGLLLGMSVASAFKGDKHDYDDDYDAYSEYDSDDDYTDDYTPTYAARSARSYSAPPSASSSSATKGVAGTAAYNTASSDAASYEPEKPGLLERFKETSAYEKLTGEVGNIGNRIADELSRTAQTVVLPMLLSKVKDFIGIDLNTQKQVAERSRYEQQTTGSSSPSSDDYNSNTYGTSNI